MKELTFEQAMERLEKIVSALDGKILSLDESLTLFSEGARLIAYCNKSLEGVKLRFEELFPGGGGAQKDARRKGEE